MTSTLAAAPRGWHKPVKPGALILFGGGLLLVWLAITVVAVWYFYETWEARFTMRDQQVMLRLPVGMKAVAQVASPIKTRIDMRPRLPLTLDQTVQVNIMDSIAARVRLDAILPIDTTVEVDAVVPVSTTLDLSVSLKSWLPRLPVSVPLTLDLPVRMSVPVRAQVPVSMDVDVSGALPEKLTVPVRGTFVLRPHVQGDIDVHMHALTLFSLMGPLDGPLEPFPVRIARAHVRVPFNLTLRHRFLP